MQCWSYHNLSVLPLHCDKASNDEVDGVACKDYNNKNLRKVLFMKSKVNTFTNWHAVKKQKELLSFSGGCYKFFNLTDPELQ